MVVVLLFFFDSGCVVAELVRVLNNMHCAYPERKYNVQDFLICQIYLVTRTRVPQDITHKYLEGSIGT